MISESERNKECRIFDLGRRLRLADNVITLLQAWMNAKGAYEAVHTMFDLRQQLKCYETQYGYEYPNRRPDETLEEWQDRTKDWHTRISSLAA